jgi:hypothetical protein
MQTGKTNSWKWIFAIAAVVALSFIIVLWRLWPFWPDIDGTINLATGFVAPWSAMITGVSALGLLYAIFLFLKTSATRPPLLHRVAVFSLLFLLVILQSALLSQAGNYLYFTAQTDYILPELLVTDNGTQVQDVNAWKKLRRPQILAHFREKVYGKVPCKKLTVSYRVLDDTQDALGGKAHRKQVRITFSNGKEECPVDVLMYIPVDSGKAVPAFLGMNFYGNQSIHKDPGIIITDTWTRNGLEFGIEDHRATERSRGVRSHRWPVEYILSSGYALVTLYYGDLDPDYDDGFRNGIHALFHEDNDAPDKDEWGAISAWAWGLSRVLDYLEKEHLIDEHRVIVMGHSRLGKTSLWAGAQDERFAMVISNESGCMGAALSRRKYGETVASITREFPHWFCKNLDRYRYREDQMPVDQHMLIALVAPRPVYVASADDDPWSDPRGEYLSAYHAGAVYRLYGMKRLTGKEMPKIEEPEFRRVGYHVRDGRHNVTMYDWEQFIHFADPHLQKHGASE